MKTCIKKSFVLPVVVGALGWLMTLPANAQFDYTNVNGTITITGYTGTNEVVVIPDTITGLPVTAIGDRGFYDHSDLTSVTIPNSVTTIGDGAFSYCFGLTNVTIPNSVANIGNGAFDSCTRLTNVTIPNSVTNIGNLAFGHCTSLSSVTIPNSVTSIGAAAFAGTSLTSVTIPDSVTNIGRNVFIDCIRLTAINVETNNPTYSVVSGVLFNQSQTTLIQYPGGKVGFYSIPNSVISIGADAFSDCPNLTSVTIPNSVTTIGDSAFDSCTRLTNVTIPDTVTSIGDGAFQYCYSLTNMTIPNSVTSIGDSAFGSCTRLTNVTIPYSVTNIGGGAFSYCFGLTNVTIPNSVTSIGTAAFQGCSSLASVTIPNSVTNIGRWAFLDCIRLKAINVETNNPTYSSVSGVVFNQSQTTLIQYPAGKVGFYSIPNSVTSIGTAAFQGCTSLTSVTIPDSVTNIGQLAFSSCSSLASVFFMGNAPYAAVACGEDCYSVFDGDNATVYYLPGTKGWGSTFGGVPTALWTPEVQTGYGSFGVKSNQFSFNVNWASGMSVVVEASPNLSNPVWSPVATNTLSGGTFYFTDPQWAKYPSRFYRVRSQ
jgi:hypothetical protein